MEEIEIHFNGALAQIMLNRPDRQNAFNINMINVLGKAFLDLGSRSDVKAIVLGAHGPAFSSGADLHWLRAMSENTWDQNRDQAQALTSMLWSIYNCPVPVIARIQGNCSGGSVALAAACDMRIGNEKAEFCLSETKLGMLSSILSPYVVRCLNEVAAARHYASAEFFSAEAAKYIGLLHEVVPLEQLDSRISSVVAGIIEKGPMEIKALKRINYNKTSQLNEAGKRLSSDDQNVHQRSEGLTLQEIMTRGSKTNG